jgi:hypothetical protein
MQMQVKTRSSNRTSLIETKLLTFLFQAWRLQAQKKKQSMLESASKLDQTFLEYLQDKSNSKK